VKSRVSRTQEEIIEDRRRIKAEYGKLYDSISELLFRHDPVGINFETNPDEYQSEVSTILPRLRECQSEEDVIKVVHHEFVRWFDESTAGSIDSYREIASDIWQLWLASKLGQSS